jgi:hypothetical protein
VGEEVMENTVGSHTRLPTTAYDVAIQDFTVLDFTVLDFTVLDFTVLDFAIQQQILVR